MIKKFTEDDKAIIYQCQSGSLEIKADVEHETIWFTQDQIATLFDVKKPAISKHLRNIFASEELIRDSVVSILETTAKDNKKYQVRHFNLDAILSVGYRVNSKKATHFRQWATKTLKDHIVKGYSLNRRRITQNYSQFLKAVGEVKKLLPKDIVVDNESVLELITLFADTWLSLDAYDRNKLVMQGATKKKVALTAERLTAALAELKQLLVKQGDASQIFGVERTKDSIVGIVGNVMQSFDKQDVYPSVEEKAAHLIYFIVKNHPFIDGNKRSGAYAFIWFLRQANILDITRITPQALTALTLLIAESSPKDKDKMVGLVCMLLDGSKSK